MSMMLKAIYAMRLNAHYPVSNEPAKVHTKAPIEEVKKSMSRADAKAQCELQLSVIVKMCLDGYSIDEVMQATGVKKSFVSATKQRFGLVRPSRKDDKTQIRDLIMNSEPYTHRVSSISKLLGLDKEMVSKTLANMQEIERGTEDGFKYSYRYNFDIKVGSGVTSCGFVG